MTGAVVVRILIAAILAAEIGLIAHQRRLLDPGGALAAVVIGVVLVGAGGWWAGILLVAFFVSSSLLSVHDGLSSAHHSKDRDGRHRAGATAMTDPSRTWRQVVANGGPATLFAVLAILFDSPALFTACAASLAAATADTWATEIGRRSGAVPRSITTLRHVPAGTSGAVSLPGSVASVAGSLGIAMLAVTLRRLAPVGLSDTFPAVIVITVAGVAGSLLDTVLGATLQARYRCDTCGARVESPDGHESGHHLRRESGVALMTNDTVNLSASAAAGLIAALLVAIRL